MLVVVLNLEVTQGLGNGLTCDSPKTNIALMVEYSSIRQYQSCMKRTWGPYSLTNNVPQSQYSGRPAVHHNAVHMILMSCLAA
jgi:hypothetical protein